MKHGGPTHRSGERRRQVAVNEQNSEPRRVAQPNCHTSQPEDDQSRSDDGEGSESNHVALEVGINVNLAEFLNHNIEQNYNFPDSMPVKKHADYRCDGYNRTVVHRYYDSKGEQNGTPGQLLSSIHKRQIKHETSNRKVEGQAGKVVNRHLDFVVYQGEGAVSDKL